MTTPGGGASDRRDRGGWRWLIGWWVPATMAALFFRLIYGVRGTGRELVPRSGPLVFVSNHQSHFDPPMIASYVHARTMSFLARQTLFRWRPFGAVIGFLGAIPMHRGRTGAEALRSAITRLAEGGCLLLFPEGTRTRDGTIGAFKGGVMLLVERTRASVVPVAVDGAFEAWPVNRRFPRWPWRIRVRVGHPIDADELLALGTDEGLERIRQSVIELHRDLKKENEG